MGKKQKIEQPVEDLSRYNRYALFQPRNKRNMLSDYPELKNLKEFTDLENPKKMVFVWYYACKVSPARDLHDDKERIRYAVSRAWNNRPPAGLLDEYLAHRWGVDVDDAIARMASYEPELRIRLKLACARHLQDFEKLVTEKPENTNFANMPDYIKIVKSSLELIQQMIPIAEGKAIGVTDIGEDDMDDSTIFEIIANQREYE